MHNKNVLWYLTQGTGPILGVALHHGHGVRSDVARRLLVDPFTRLREEDPFTGDLASIIDTRLVVHRSRFEMDLNRYRKKAVYLKPSDAWGIQVWKYPPEQDIMRRSLAQYDAFYQVLRETLTTMIQQHGMVVVLDFHSYNHHRKGPDKPFDDPRKLPDIEIGTDTMDRSRWAQLVNRFVDDLRRGRIDGKNLDVRENVNLGSGWMSQWIHEQFPRNACAISVEVKKNFMDEWTGNLYPEVFDEYKKIISAALPGLLDSLRIRGSYI